MKLVRRFRVPEPVARTIRGLHPQLKRKLRAALDMLAGEALAGKALHGELEGLRSLPVGRLRVIYRPRDPRVIEIVAVGPRERIYEETLRLVKSERQA